MTPPATVNGRRHSSSSHYFTTEIEHHHRTPSPPIVINQTISNTSITTSSSSNSSATNVIISSNSNSSGISVNGGGSSGGNTTKKQRPEPLPLVPPPVPKRTFQSKYHQRHQRSPRETMNYSNPSYEPTSASYSQYLTSKTYGYPRSPYGNDISPGSTYSAKIQHHSLSDFDDIGDTDDLVLYDKKTYIDSNKSSSDSNRSQMTIDTGYMSANETERSSIYTANTNNSAPRSFRSRFSSEDTQCSLDSFTSTELQRTDTTDSISNTNYNDSPFSTTKKNVFTFDRRFYERSSSAQSEASESPGPITQQRRLPALPARKPQKHGQMTRNRSMPPTPPMRPSLMEGKLLQNGQTLQGFQQQINNAKAALEEGSEPPNHLIRESHNPPLRKIHGSKLNQRQDSSLSNDSYSLTSSPGYSTKSTMEIPLLQHGSKISRTDTPLVEAHLRQQQESDNDNLGPIISAKSMKKKKSVPPKVNIRQDSNISSDSFSQTSSPSYNSKQLMETPLLANAAKLHTIKPTFNNIDEIEKAKDDNETNSAITKSASTPASLQTIVRLSNGSTNMSLQHKILKIRKNSNPYITRGRLKFRFWQIFINVIAIIAILGKILACLYQKEGHVQNWFVYSWNGCIFHKISDN